MTINLDIVCGYSIVAKPGIYFHEHVQYVQVLKARILISKLNTASISVCYVAGVSKDVKSKRFWDLFKRF